MWNERYGGGRRWKGSTVARGWGNELAEATVVKRGKKRHEKRRERKGEQGRIKGGEMGRWGWRGGQVWHRSREEYINDRKQQSKPKLISFTDDGTSSKGHSLSRIYSSESRSITSPPFATCGVLQGQMQRWKNTPHTQTNKPLDQVRTKQKTRLKVGHRCLW